MDPLALRFLERFTVVLFGGMAIYLGYRLFLKVPGQQNSAGKIELPWDISIVMTRVGPGAFFALFGVIAVGLALVRPLEINPQALNNAENQSGQASVRYGSNPEFDNYDARADTRALLRKEIAALNTIPGLLREDLPQFERNSIERRIQYIKLALMKPVWGETSEGFGEFSEFERWVEGAEVDPAPKEMEGALALYHYGSKERKP